MEKTFSTAADVIGEFFEIRTEVLPGGEQQDGDTKAAKTRVSVGEQRSVEIYPWGKNNMLPNEMMDLARSNANMGNLLDTRADFLFGAGIGLFQKNMEGKELTVKEYWTPLVYEKLLELGIEEMVDTGIRNTVHLENAFINVSFDKTGKFGIKCLDSTTVRCEKVADQRGRIGNYVLSGRWNETKKYATVVPRYDYADPKKYPESIIHLKPDQPGQFYYAYAGWWALQVWIKVDNKIAPFYLESLETEGNLGHIIHIAKKYFEDILAQSPKKPDGKEYTMDELIKAFDKTIDDVLLGGGKRKTIRDVCGYDLNTGKLVKFLELEPVKKTITGKEFQETQTSALVAMAGGSKVLSGLSNVSDGKMNSGGGTEIMNGARYQQYHRTPRERRAFIELLNRVVLPQIRDELKIPADVFFDFKNILLETLDKNKSGVSETKANNV